MCSAIKHWSHPVKGENEDAFLELTKFAKAAGGFYPMGSNGLWHGGIHLDEVTHPTLSAGVRCIADGEVIAYRIDSRYPISVYRSGSRTTQAPFSTGFVLVRHRLAPAAEDAGSPPALVLYSLYMHLQDWAGYQANASQKRPAFWNDGICSVATQKTPLTIRPRPIKDNGESIGSLPKGTRVRVAPGKGEYRKLLQILDESAAVTLRPDANGQLPGYISANYLSPEESPPVTDEVVVLEQPLPIAAGALIGHSGLYQNHDGVAKPLLHLEVFSCEDVPVYLQQSRSWADAHLPDRQKTQLKVYAGASKLIAHHPGISASTPPQLSDPGTVVGVDLIIPQSYLDTLPAERKISVKTPQGVTRWWHLDNLLADAQGQPISGWLAEQELITTRHSPWEWEGFECIEDSESPKEGLAYHLNALHRLIDSELASYQGLVDQSETGPIKSRLNDIIDANLDGKITPAGIRTALAKPWQAQSIAQLITRHESEWFWNPEKWNALDDLMGHSPSDPNPAWVTEKERIQKLCWWSDLAGKHGINADGIVWHFHAMPLILSKLKKSNWQESPFVNLLGKVESKNDYSAYNILNPLRSRYKTNLTNLTINQLQEKQNNEEIFAAGRYQIIPKTLSLAVNYLKIDTSLKFDKKMQDRIFYEYLIRVKRKEIIHYLSSGEGIEDAIYAWAKEFASAGVRKGKPLSPRLLRDKNGNPVKKDGDYVRIPRTARFEGESFYSGDGLNVAHITPDNMVKALAESMEYEWNSDN